MSVFEELVFTRTARAIASIDESSRIYALSMYVYDTSDDPRSPTVTIGYNTEDMWRSEIPKASDSVEAKWNYAFWPQIALAVIPDDSAASDVEGVAARRVWINENGLSADDAREDELPEEGGALNPITAHFVELCVAVSKRLHASGIIVAKFGEPIPVLVHELEYYDQIAYQTREANPPGVAEEFVQWVFQWG